MRAGRLPGVWAAVDDARRAAVVARFGEANLARGRHVGSGTLFMLASISKTVICTAVMQAVEDGLFALDDDVDDVLPFSVGSPGSPPGGSQSSVADAHLVDPRPLARVGRPVLRGRLPIGLGEFLEGYLVPGGEDYRAGNFYRFAPGKAYRYSNVGASLAAYLVEAASGIGFDEWCNDRSSSRWR